MSIIIKGLDMPKDCVGLSIVIHTENNMSRPLIIYKKDIIEIPTPHGRLIDFSKIEFEDVSFDKVTINAPTVIESED